MSARHLLVAAAALSACPSAPEPPHLLYDADPQALDNPFPDARLASDGGLAFRPDWYRPFLMQEALTPAMVHLLSEWASSAASVTAVGTFGPTLLPTSEPVDPATLANTAARLVQAPAGWQVLEADVAVEPSTEALSGTGLTASPGYPQFLMAHPRVPLPDGASGLLVFRSGMRTLSGALLRRGRAFDQAPASRALIQTAATTLGIAPSDVLLVLPQSAVTVASVTSALAQWAGRQAPAFTIPSHGTAPDPQNPAASIPVGVWKSTDSDWGVAQQWLQARTFSQPASDVDQIVVGSYASVDLRGPSGEWPADPALDPDHAPARSLYFALALPAGPKPPGGYRVIICGHGLTDRNIPQLGDSTSVVLNVAEPFARLGLATLGIDAVSHGTRGNPYDFFNLNDVAVMRDSVRQTMFDLWQLSELLAVLDVDGDGVPDFSPEVGYFGNSLGSVIGADFVAFDTRVRYGVLNVGGGGLTDVVTSPMLHDVLGLILAGQAGLTFQSEPYEEAFPLFRAVGQLIVDPGDPINLGQAFRPTDKALLLQVGLGDQIITNPTSENLAGAMGLTRATTAISGSAALRVLYEVNPQQYGEPADYNGHGIFWDIPFARTQAETFLRTKGTTLVTQ